MRHRPYPVRLTAVLVLALMLLSGLTVAPATAQDDQTPEPSAEAATGSLLISTFACIRDDVAEGTVTVSTSDALAAFDCESGGSATISIDGGEPIEVADSDELELAAGPHNVTEVSQGGALQIDVPADGEVTVAISTAVAPDAEEPEDEPTATEESVEAAEEVEEAAEGSIRVVTHLCRRGIDDAAELDALSWSGQIVACPVAVLPDDYGDITPDSITANDPDDPATYDLTINYDVAGTETSVSIADAALMVSALCEADLGNLNGDGDDNRCWDQSGYGVSDATEGDAEILATDLPEDYSLALARGADGSDDGAAITGYDADSVSLTTTGNPEVAVHLFLLPEPLQNTLTVIGHLCPEPITSRTAFTGIGDFYDQIVTCPSFVLPGDSPAPGGLTAGELSPTILVRGSDEVGQAMADVAFEQRLVCESDLPQNIDGDPNNDLCLDLSRYVFSGVTQGTPVTVAAAGAAPGTKYVGVAFEPGSGDDATFVSAGAFGTIKLDTTADGDVTIHVFYGPEPPATATATATKTPAVTRTPTPGGPTATRTPTPDGPTVTRTPDPDDPTAAPTEGSSGTGSLQVFKLWCEGSESLSRMTVLAPGADATRGDLGDATCANGNTEFILYGPSGNELQAFMVPPSGVLVINDLPATSSGLYRLVDTRSSESANFEIDAGVVTKIISLQWMEVREVDDPTPFATIDVDDKSPPPDDECFEDGCPYEFGGPVAEPGSGDPFTVEDDPEAGARVDEVDSFEDIPGVGVGVVQTRRPDYLPWMAALALVCGAFVTMRLRLGRRWRRQ